ncbi:MAG: hypothetical protein AVDCRST_MAG49-1460 [uncultured Thermomicrobiales bacterium]|uniref:Uncharacterized protein n=1 Tax=uncultured Thermomicrobiales bacterium TaxID=1645740 RepID=A0A6J4UCV7_9BACT|nr:MAG: hypothetical protein AVDCRST_MAG49-1460 [uncultured Thermomicrobiales bacterium]
MAIEIEVAPSRLQRNLRERSDGVRWWGLRPRPDADRPFVESVEFREGGGPIRSQRASTSLAPALRFLGK